MGIKKRCYKLRKDRKSIALLLASKLYHEGGSLRDVSNVFKVHHKQLIKKFRCFDVPLKSKTEASNGKNRLWMVGERNHGWKGGYSITKQGYVSNNRTKKRLHREIAEMVLGRKMTRDEVVHHLDGDKLNNRNNNLLICSKEYHQWLHAKMCNGKIGINHIRR